MSYVILEKDGMGTQEITDKKEAQDKVNEGFTVKINKAGWVLKKQSKKPTAKKTKKKTKE